MSPQFLPAAVEAYHRTDARARRQSFQNSKVRTLLIRIEWPSTAATVVWSWRHVLAICSMGWKFETGKPDVRADNDGITYGTAVLRSARSCHPHRRGAALSELVSGSLRPGWGRLSRNGR